MTTLRLPDSLHLPADTPLAEVQARLRPLGLEISPIRRPRVLDVRPLRPTASSAARAVGSRRAHDGCDV